MKSEIRMNANTLKWEFIPNDANLTQGLNDAGIETFRGSQIPSLTREVIQNSIDAVSNANLPVRVRFSLENDIDFGQRQLASTFDRCWQSTEHIETERALAFFRKGAPELEMNAQIQTLLIEDFNTTGLADNRWHMLVKAEGVGDKSRSDALGSYGIGKMATFAASNFRTVLYSTQFTTPHCVVRKFQGKSILVSHRDERDRRRGAIGFFGGESWGELKEVDGDRGTIPSKMGRYSDGTSLYVVGFDAEPGWLRQLISSVVSNFFFAILIGKLVVDVDGADQEGLPNRIDKESIAATFEALCLDSTVDETLKDAKALFETVAVKHERTCDLRQATISGQLQYLGHTKIWIRVAEGLPNKALIVRDPGMAICDGVRRLPYLKRLPGNWGDFAAVVMCADKIGNELLRSMEPPAHDNFEPDRLKGVGEGSAASKGESALSELGRRIRDWVDRQMPKLDNDEIESLDDLAEFFPSEDLDTDSNPIGEETDPFGNSIVGETAAKLPTVRQPTRPTEIDEDDTLTDDEGDQERFPTGRPGRGGENGNPNRNRGPRKRSRGPRGSISGVRMYRDNGRLSVAFTPEETFSGELMIALASEEKRNEDYVEITRLTDQTGLDIPSTGIKLENGQRVRFTVDTATPLPVGHAVIVETIKEVNS